MRKGIKVEILHLEKKAASLIVHRRIFKLFLFKKSMEKCLVKLKKKITLKK